MIIGASQPKYAVYNNNNGQVTYSDGGTIARLVQVDVDIEAANDNDFRSDNSIDCSDSTFGGGTLSMTTNDLLQQVSKVILGLKSQPIGTIEGITDQDVEELIYDNTQESPYLGIGFVIKHKNKSGITWRAVILRKVQFDIPADAATTQGETIEWQTPELTGHIYRDDTESEAWKQEATFSSEGQAIKYINNRLNIQV